MMPAIPNAVRPLPVYYGLNLSESESIQVSRSLIRNPNNFSQNRLMILGKEINEAQVCLNASVLALMFCFVVAALLQHVGPPQLSINVIRLGLIGLAAASIQTKQLFSRLTEAGADFSKTHYFKQALCGCN